MKNRLKVLRAARHWSQNDLAARLGVTRQTVNGIETGRCAPTLAMAFRIAAAFGTSVDRVFDPGGESKGSASEDEAGPGQGVTGGVPGDQGGRSGAPRDGEAVVDCDEGSVGLGRSGGRPLREMIAVLHRLVVRHDEFNDRRLAELGKTTEHLQRQVDTLRALVEKSPGTTA